MTKCLLAISVLTIGMGFDTQAAQDVPATSQEEAFTLDGPATTTDEAESKEPSFLDALKENLRFNFDIVSRFATTSRRGELESMQAIGFDIRKVISNDDGDIATVVLQPYLLRADNVYARPIEFDQDDAWSVQAHDFYINVTRWGRGRTNIKVGHFDVPFGLEPNVDTHFTLRQFIPLHDAGFKKDWGFALNGALPQLDYEISLTRGTGPDFTGSNLDPYLFAGRIGTPSDQNFVLGLSGLYGETIDDHGTHRYDEGNPAGEPTEEGQFMRRWRFGGDVTKIIEQWTFRGELSTGQDFDDWVINSIAEVSWTSVDEKLMAYLQFIYLNQDGFLGWSDDIKTRLGLRWSVTPTLTLSAEWIHEFERYASQEGGIHLPEDAYILQLRVRF